MTDQESSVLAILFGLGVFAVIVAVGWRSVQNRRIIRLRDAEGHETIIIADEDDDFSSVSTTTETTQPAPAPGEPIDGVDTSDAHLDPGSEFGRKGADS